MGMRLAGALALVLGAVAFAGPAFAGNGNGNGNNGKADSSAAAAAPGNSAGAPGQLKKDQGASTEAPVTTTATTTVSTTTTASSDQGVKPANDTAHDTHAAASSTKTKLYGNGQTAGQIATKNVTRRKARPSSSPGRGSGAALAAVQRPSGATLPFTGFPLWIGVAVGIVLLALGLALSLLAGRETEREVGP